MNARVVSHGHFGDREPMHERKRWEKSVHALEQRDPFQHGTPEYLERATGVVNAVARKEIPHPIGDPGGQFFYQAILPLLSPSTDEIVGGSIGEEFQDVLAILLQIAVNVDDDFTG